MAAGPHRTETVHLLVTIMSLHQSAYACVLACTWSTLYHFSFKDCNIYMGFYTYVNVSAKSCLRSKAALFT